MFLPVRTDRPLRTKPVINIAIIVINVIVHMLVHKGGPYQFEATAGPYFLDPQNPSWYQFITSVFLHADWWHLIGNMALLYVFGNNVEDRLGHVGYAAFYLAGGVLAGLGHAMVDNSPVLGASGAVSAVSGGFLALFPLTRVTILYIFFFIGFFQIPSMYLILFFFAQDALFYMNKFGGVAYMAHMAGTAYGFTLGILLLKSRVLAREPYDMISMLEHRKRRREFRSLARDPGFQPWDASKPGMPPKDGFESQVEEKLKPVDPAIVQKRSEITRAISSHNLDRACELYAEVLDADGEQVLSQSNQLDLANHYASQERYSLSARAYELLINTYRSLPDRDSIQLMLALIYVRYLQRGQRARELLAEVTPRLRNDDEKAMAKILSDELENIAG